MKFFCLFGIHYWKYGPVYIGTPNGYLSEYHVQDKVCQCCNKTAVVFAEGGIMK